ncbi:MAG: hypothetical protein WD342_17100 [Verrucomicrobiales bacterium]
MEKPGWKRRGCLALVCLGIFVAYAAGRAALSATGAIDANSGGMVFETFVFATFVLVPCWIARSMILDPVVVETPDEQADPGEPKKPKKGSRNIVMLFVAVLAWASVFFWPEVEDPEVGTTVRSLDAPTKPVERTSGEIERKRNIEIIRRAIEDGPPPERRQEKEHPEPLPLPEPELEPEKDNPDRAPNKFI